jgi:hypothetical protein
MTDKIGGNRRRSCRAAGPKSIGPRRASWLLLTATAICALTALGGCAETTESVKNPQTGNTTETTTTYIGPYAVSATDTVRDSKGTELSKTKFFGDDSDYHEGGPGGNDKQGGQQSSGQQISSDIRLKRDLVEVGRLGNGIHLYHFRYNWADQEYVGVVAQEVAKIAPNAVSRGPGGYLQVDYGKLGLRLESWDEWLREHPQRAVSAK